MSFLEAEDARRINSSLDILRKHKPDFMVQLGGRACQGFMRVGTVGAIDWMMGLIIAADTVTYERHFKFGNGPHAAHNVRDCPGPRSYALNNNGKVLAQQPFDVHGPALAGDMRAFSRRVTEGEGYLKGEGLELAQLCVTHGHYFRNDIFYDHADSLGLGRVL